jgi:fatty-acyl-CoA synthase
MPSWNAQVLADVLSRNAELFPGQEAVVIGERRLTYGELQEKVAEAAQGLRALGIKRGDHVAVSSNGAKRAWRISASRGM